MWDQKQIDPGVILIIDENKSSCIYGRFFSRKQEIKLINFESFSKILISTLDHTEKGLNIQVKIKPLRF